MGMECALLVLLINVAALYECIACVLVEGWEAPLGPGPGVEVLQPGGGVQSGAPHRARARDRVLDTACTQISIVSSVYNLTVAEQVSIKVLKSPRDSIRYK